MKSTINVTLGIPNRVREGEPAPFMIKVENAGDESITLRYGMPFFAFNFIAETSGWNPRQVWNRLAQQKSIPLVGTETALPPDETLEFGDVWDLRSSAGNPIPPGIYCVRGVFHELDGPLTTESRALLVVESRQ